MPKRADLRSERRMRLLLSDRTRTLVAARPTCEAAAAVPVARIQARGKCFGRAGGKLRIQGVTYGPFAPNAQGEPFPSQQQVRDDIRAMQGVGINSLRTYHVPPAWLLGLAEELGHVVFVDVPWRKHLCF